MSLRDDLLPVFDDVARGIPNELGLRRYDLFVRKIQWTGERAGLGDRTVVDFPITVNKGTLGLDRPKVVQLTTRELIASSYQEGDWRIGPLTPSYTENNITYGSLPSDIEALIEANDKEIFINMQGPGMDPTEGTWFQIVNTNFSRNFGYTFVIRQTNEKP